MISLAAWMPSSLRFFSMSLERATAALSSADMAQPIFGKLQSFRRDNVWLLRCPFGDRKDFLLFTFFFRFFGSFLFLLLLWRLTALFASSWSTWDFVCCAAVYISPLARLADRPRHPRRSLFRHHTQHHTLALSLLGPRKTITTTGREEEEDAKILLFFSTQQHTHTHTGHKTLGQRSTRCCLFPKRRQPHSAALMANDEEEKDETVRRGSNLVLFCGKIKKSRLAFFVWGCKLPTSFFLSVVAHPVRLEWKRWMCVRPRMENY